MHVADQLKRDNLSIKILDELATLENVFPNPHKYDRYGFVVTEPYGVLGASLLIQAAIVQFYDLLPIRRTVEPMYPEIYVFHVGGRFGDHSSFDFWPPRKEVFLDSRNPADILSALVDRGITRLAVPEGPEGDPTVLQEGASTWADHAAAKQLISTCLLYNANSQTEHADLFLQSVDPSFEANAEWTLDRDIILSRYRQDPESIYRAGPTAPADIERWVQRMQARHDEVDGHYAKSLLTQRRTTAEGQLVRRESFRRIDLEQTFRQLAAL